MEDNVKELENWSNYWISDEKLNKKGVSPIAGELFDKLSQSEDLGLFMIGFIGGYRLLVADDVPQEKLADIKKITGNIPLIFTGRPKVFSNAEVYHSA